ncbi:MAG: hypothetical protein JO112_15885 [Planctomycetes bacterium]|nr:hypothetical protein [Planctomycetota bacterium]
MRKFAAVVLVLGFFAPWADGADRLDQLFASWQEAQHSVRALVVEFILEYKDPFFNEPLKAEGTFRLIRTSRGEVFALYETTYPGGKAEKQERFIGLLNLGRVYLLDPDKKKAIRFEPKDGDVTEFLGRNFNPFVWLLDRRRAQDQFQVEVIKQDQWYTYLAIKPKQDKPSGWFPNNGGRIVLMNKSSAAVPKDMPRELGYYTGGADGYVLFEVKAWRLNPPEAPKMEEFTRPEDRPGWQVSEWPFGRKMELENRAAEPGTTAERPHH